MDIVAAYYPESTPPNEWKLRRCIVTDVLQEDDGSFAIEIAYGTSRPTHYGWPHLHVHNSSDLSAMCLERDTRFVMGQRAIIAWALGPCGYMYGKPTPKLSTLLPDYHQEFYHCMAAYQAAQQNAQEEAGL